MLSQPKRQSRRKATRNYWEAISGLPTQSILLARLKYSRSKNNVITHEDYMINKQQSERIFFVVGALLAGLAVAVGSFSAHGAVKMLSADAVRWLEKGARYEMYHALALFPVAWAPTYWPQQAKTLKAAGWLFIAGTALFSGSLYLMAFTGINLGYVTPTGGVAYMLGWIALAVAAWKSQDG